MTERHKDYWTMMVCGIFFGAVGMFVLTGCTVLRRVAKVVWLFVEDNPSPNAWDDSELEANDASR